MNVQAPKQMSVILTLCVPTLKGRMFARVLANIRVMEETARVNISCSYVFDCDFFTRAA